MKRRKGLSPTSVFDPNLVPRTFITGRIA
jgi:hypothetical protein